MRLVQNNCVVLESDAAVQFSIPYYVARAADKISDTHRVDGIKFLREWWRDVRGVPLGLKDAKDICDYIRANPHCLAQS